MKISKYTAGRKVELSSAETRDFFNNYKREVNALEDIVNKLSDALTDGVVIGFSLSIDGNDDLVIGSGIFIDHDGITFYESHTYSMYVQSGNYVVMDRQGNVSVSPTKTDVVLGYYDGSSFSYDCRSKYLNIDREPSEPSTKLDVQIAEETTGFDSSTDIGYATLDKKFYIFTGDWDPVLLSNVIGGL